MDDKVLQEYFFFDDADLNANRKGQLSEKQLKKLKIEYNLRIGKVKLQVVSNDCTEIMKIGDVYAVYYYDLKDVTGNQVASLEWVANGKA